MPPLANRKNGNIIVETGGQDEMKIEFFTQTGKKVVIEKDDNGMNPRMSADFGSAVLADHPCQWGSVVQKRQTYSGLLVPGEWTDPTGKKTNRILSRPKPQDVKRVREFFAEQETAEKAKAAAREEDASHMHDVFLTSYAGGDFAVHAYLDDRWTRDRMIEEVASRLRDTYDFGSRAFTDEGIAQFAPKVVDEWLKKRSEKVEAAAAEKARRQAVLANVRYVEVGPMCRSDGGDGDDYSCDVKVTALDGTVYRRLFCNVFDVGLVVPQDWPQVAIDAAVEMLPVTMQKLHM